MQNDEESNPRSRALSESKIILRGNNESETVKKEDTNYNIIKSVWSNGMYLLEYDSAALNRLQKRKDKIKERTCGIIQILTSYWCAVFIILVVMLIIAY